MRLYRILSLREGAVTGKCAEILTICAANPVFCGAKRAEGGYVFQIDGNFGVVSISPQYFELLTYKQSCVIIIDLMLKLTTLNFYLL